MTPKRGLERSHRQIVLTEKRCWLTKRMNCDKSELNSVVPDPTKREGVVTWVERFVGFNREIGEMEESTTLVGKRPAPVLVWKKLFLGGPANF